MLILTETDVSTLLRDLSGPDATHLLTTLSTALAAFTAEKQQQQDGSSPAPLIHQPQRTAITTQPAQDTTLIMPVSNTARTAVKVVTLPRAGAVKGALSVFAPTGALKGVLNAAELTAFRTALAVMTLLTRWCGSEGKKLRNVVVFGAGRQVEWHVRLALKLLPVGGADGVRRVTVFNRGERRLRELEAGVLGELREGYPDVGFETVAREGGEEVYRERLRSRLGEADGVFCCTPSTEPLFAARDFAVQGAAEKSRFMSLIGSYKPEMQEIDTETLRSAARIWVDSTHECLIESGELIRAEVKPEELTEVGELYSQNGDARVEEPGLTLFKCVGFGLMDLVIGDALLELGKRLGKGVTVDGF